ncbi:RpiB/LacA/LacB family sugar-phosphate isomerase [Streptomyces violascens]|uniref:RpiB/LacA/LacB family sugar-phosphate isomerase n=1 Tax=Streptomyces violascens TaxID=67381 RepID=UPI003650EC13
MMHALHIAIGSDRAGRHYMETLADDLRSSNQVATVIDIGAAVPTQLSYPEAAFKAAQLVAAGKADRALLVCHTGLGMAIVANKVAGIRAVTAHDSLSVEHAICSNNAQVLAFGQGVIGLALARRLAKEWLTYEFDALSPAAVKVQAITTLEDALLSGKCDAH